MNTLIALIASLCVSPDTNALVSARVAAECHAYYSACVLERRRVPADTVMLECAVRRMRGSKEQALRADTAPDEPKPAGKIFERTE